MHALLGRLAPHLLVVLIHALLWTRVSTMCSWDTACSQTIPIGASAGDDAHTQAQVLPHALCCCDCVTMYVFTLRHILPEVYLSHTHDGVHTLATLQVPQFWCKVAAASKKSSKRRKTDQGGAPVMLRTPFCGVLCFSPLVCAQPPNS